MIRIGLIVLATGCVVSGRYEVVRNPVAGRAASDGRVVRNELCALKPQRCDELSRWDVVVLRCEGPCRLVTFVPREEDLFAQVDGGVVGRLHSGASGVICDEKVLMPEWRESMYGCGHPMLQGR
jgi:hypothetical protein